MALEILTPVSETVTWVIAAQRLWLTADRSRLVEDGDQDAAFLFCVPDRQISLDEARRYGLTAAAISEEEAGGSEKTAGSTAEEAAPDEEVKEAQPDGDKETRAHADKGLTIPPQSKRASRARK